MVYRKYREIKQWGKVNTRIFKQMVRNKEYKRMPHFEVPAALQEMGVEIHNPNKPGFFEKQIHMSAQINHAMFRAPRDEDHPLYQAAKTYLFEGNRSFADGVDQACSLLNALKAKPFPSSIINADKLELPENIEELVVDSIMAGERYDPTLEKLEKRHDPVLFWTIKYPLYGVPPIKKLNVILENLYRRVYLYATNKGKMRDHRCDYDAPLSSYLSADLFGANSSLVIRHQPHLFIQSTKPVDPIASKSEVQATINEKAPDVYPISPLIDLESTHIYNTNTIIPRSQIPNLHTNTSFFGKQLNQKYPFTTEELAANAIVFCFGSALAQAQRYPGKIDLLEQPIVTKAVQLVDGRLDLVAFQLNTLDLNNSEGVKNLVWLEKGLPLYSAKPYYENFEKVEELDMSVFKKFANLLLY